MPRNSELTSRLRQARLVAFDFDGVFTDNTVYVNQEGVETVRCWRGDGLGLEALTRIGIPSVIISTEINPVVKARAGKLKIRCIHGCGDKLAALSRLVSEAGIQMEQVVFVGNDINDLPCLAVVGVPIVVNDAHPDVLAHACYRTACRGGRGAVREVCDLIVRAHEAKTE